MTVNFPTRSEVDKVQKETEKEKKKEDDDRPVQRTISEHDAHFHFDILSWCDEEEDAHHGKKKRTARQYARDICKGMVVVVALCGALLVSREIWPGTPAATSNSTLGSALSPAR